MHVYCSIMFVEFFISSPFFLRRSLDSLFFLATLQSMPLLSLHRQIKNEEKSCGKRFKPTTNDEEDFIIKFFDWKEMRRRKKKTKRMVIRVKRLIHPNSSHLIEETCKPGKISANTLKYNYSDHNIWCNFFLILNLCQHSFVG